MPTVRTLVLALSVMSAPIAAPTAWACQAPDELVFEVLRGERPIGFHAIRFTPRDQETQVDIEIDLRVGFGPITMFRYEHRNREIWRDGRLVSLETETDDNGEQFQVSAQATPAGLEVTGSSGSFIAPADTLPTSYWNIDTLEQTQLLDTQRGRLVWVDIAPGTRQVISLGNASAIAQRNDISGDLNLSVWYTEEGRLGRIAFAARGAEVDYRPICSDTLNKNL